MCFPSGALAVDPALAPWRCRPPAWAAWLNSPGGVLRGLVMRASKPKRIYAPRIISDHIMVQEDFERLHKFLLEMEGLSEISDDMRELVEEEWPELVHKLPPKVA